MEIKEIEKIVHEACKKEDNTYGYSSWDYHINSVIKYSKILAKKLDADEEILELAALLHDYAAICNRKFESEHHIYGANLAEKVLKKYKYPKDKIEKVKHCILAHRGSQNIHRETLEAKILASADALAHFNNVNSLLYLVYVNKKMSIDEGTKWVLKKLARSWNKLMPEAKKLIRDKYKAIRIALEN